MSAIIEMMAIATMTGKVVPLWKRTFLPLPLEASLATLLADDEVATRVRGYRFGSQNTVRQNHRATG